MSMNFSKISTVASLALAVSSVAVSGAYQPAGDGNVERPVAVSPVPQGSLSYEYHAREPVTGAYVVTQSPAVVRADEGGWSSNSDSLSDHSNLYYIFGPADTAFSTETFLTVRASEPVLQITWVLPDGSQRVQRGDLTYYNPEDTNL